MATTSIATQTLSSGYSTTGDSITWTAADVANGNHFTWSGAGKVIVLARNVHATTTYTVTITSVAHSVTGRTGSVSAVNVAAGAQTAFPLVSDGWKNSSDQVALSANNANIQFAILITAH